MQFHIDCACGRSIPVTAAKAGSEVTCLCGQVNAVPLLSQLRRQSGHDPYVTNAVEWIEKLTNTGHLPPSKCVKCGATTTDEFRCEAVCERVWIKESGGGQSGLMRSFTMIFLAVFTGILFLFLRRSDPDEVEHHGRDLVVSLPFRLCRPCQDTTNLTHPGELRATLALVDPYRRLLQEYPEAEVYLGA